MVAEIPPPLISIRVASSSDINAIQSCRYDVYSEMGFINPADFPDRRESDEYDNYSKSVIASYTAAVNAVGTTRLVLGSGGDLPIEDKKHHSIDTSGYGNVAEISRLCVRKKFREGKISLGMYRVLFHIVDVEKIDTVFAIVDEDFYRMITWLGFPFKQIGKPMDHMGITIPTVCIISDVMQSLNDSETANMFGITELFAQPFAGEILM